MFLAADVGGTKTFLGLYDFNKSDLKPLKKEKFSSKNYQSLEAIVQEFLKDKQEKIKAATFGIAGPVIEGVVTTPNLPWRVEKTHLQKLLGTDEVFLINDLLANAYGIQTLTHSDFFVINEGKENKQGNQALVSAGTGLGEAGLVFHESKLIPFPSEGGHSSFSCHKTQDMKLFEFLFKKYHGHVSTERVLSGQGLENLYLFVKQVEGVEPKEKNKMMSAKEISQAALEFDCPAAKRALFLFVEFYGAEAGDAALKFLATGGVFIGGGIAPKILKAFDSKLFFNAFIDKGRLKSLLETIPVKVILNEETALNGAASYTKKAHKG